MRKPLVAGNWKMNKTIAETRDLVFTMSMKLRKIEGVEKASTSSRPRKSRSSGPAITSPT